MLAVNLAYHRLKNLFLVKRNKTEAELYISSGGVVDVLSLALRMAFWSLDKTKRPLLLLDEPLKHLSEDLQSRASDMLQMLSSKLGIQILMVTHEKALLEAVNKEFSMKLENGISIILNERKEG